MHQSYLSNKNEKIFSRCLNEAKESNLLHQHGCVATYGGKIIAHGCNTYKSYSSRDMFLNRVCSCHAEINVLRQIYHANRRKKHKLNKIMKRTTLYISRYTDKGTNSNSSAPCMECLNMIKQFKIKRIVFKLNDSYHVMSANEYYTEHRCQGDLVLDRKMSMIRPTSPTTTRQ